MGVRNGKWVQEILIDYYDIGRYLIWAKTSARYV